MPIKSKIEKNQLTKITDEALARADDGDLFLESVKSESLLFDDNVIKAASYNVSGGFGLRAVSGEATGYAHSSNIDEKSLLDASQTVKSIKLNNKDFSSKLSVKKTNQKIYDDDNPTQEGSFKEKVNLLENINDYARKQDSKIKQVTCSLSGSYKDIEIIKKGGERIKDTRPLVRLNVSVILGNGKRSESGSFGAGGRQAYEKFCKPESWKYYVDEAIRQANVNLESVEAPAGEMKVVLGPGWPGILLHEAIGHGLEGDFNRKKISAFSNLLGEKIATKDVTVVDDGTLKNRRGSLTVDDEGTPTNRTVLIENGILKNYMNDRLNARLMKMSPTGNGRRESYECNPMPRMTNTFMLSGTYHPEEIIKSVEDGIYAVAFGGGEVDITNGKFVFSCTEAYKIKNGKVEAPIKGATLIGNGPDVLTKVTMVGNDLQLDSGVGTCGKDGQSVPVGVGQPTILIDNLTVGGTSS
jgi:TldD protein